VKKYIIAFVGALIINFIGFVSSALLANEFAPFEMINPTKNSIGVLAFVLLYKITVDAFFKILERRENKEQKDEKKP